MRPKNLFISRWEEYTAMLGLAQSIELCELFARVVFRIVAATFCLL